MEMILQIVLNWSDYVKKTTKTKQLILSMLVVHTRNGGGRLQAGGPKGPSFA